MKKELIEELLNLALENGADFAEIYYEVSNSKSYNLSDNVIDNVAHGNSKGLGLRVAYQEEIYYALVNDLRKSNIIKMMKKLVEPFKCIKKQKKIKLGKLKTYINKVKISHEKLPFEKKSSILKNTNSTLRKMSSLVSQVNVNLNEKERYELIANSNGLYVENTSIYTGFHCSVYTSINGRTESCSSSKNILGGYEFLEMFDYIEESKKALDIAVRKLDAIDFEGGEVPVIIANGFGGVIFHEACVHGFEATSIAPGLSIFKDSLGKKIASNKVTIIDDATIPYLSGSNKIDNEGNIPKKNILVEKGILKGYLVDNLNAPKMNHKSTSSGRRESYKYAPTSRMNNTYLEKGTDNISDMIKSITLGVYCKRLSGGSVDPITGDFNFAVSEAYLIENGKVGKMIKGITLIGNGKEILDRVEMVAKDLEHSDGYCGSKSGTVLVTVGQPTIKVSKILVGGRK